VFSEYNLWVNSRCIITVRHSVHCANGNKGQRKFTYLLFSLFRGIKTNMLLIIFLGLIATLTSVSGDCDVGISERKYFDWYKVGAGVMIRFLKQAALKLLLVFIFYLLFH